MTSGKPSRRLSQADMGNDLPYDRSKVRPGIVHLGVGAFFRAHLAAYVDETLRYDPSFGIVGASLRRPDTRDALAPQDFLYTLSIRNGDGMDARVIGALMDVIDAGTQREKLLAVMAAEETRIVSLTITEKGYCHDPATGLLDACHPDIQHDLAHPAAPISAPGLIARALERRRTAGIAPFTVLCCDNLPANGETTAAVVTGFAELCSRDLAHHIKHEVAFPSTMVDRIVPATTDDDRRLVDQATGRSDAWPVMTEPFTQFVIEDRFPSGRPAFERCGAEMVSDVRPFELAKLRMLNGSHSMLAYLGYLAGYAFVSEAMADKALRELVSAFMTDEVMETLTNPAQDLDAYREALLRRFDNPALQHRTWQIAMDGSQKLPQRLLGTIRDRLARGLPITRAALGVAAWMRYVAGVDERGRKIDVVDPLAAELARIAESTQGSPEKMAGALLGLSEIFGHDLARNTAFVTAVTDNLSSLFEDGASTTIRNVNQQTRP